MTEVGAPELSTEVGAPEAAAREHQRLIDELWDFSDPAASEIRFRSAAEQASDADSAPILETQFARALGLQRRFDEAAAALDLVEARDQMPPELRVRVALERGRVLNSSGSPAAARPLFERAYELAAAAGLEHLTVDALHMVAIVAAPGEQATLNEQALAIASAASDPRARDWRASLLNNLGWARFEAGEYAEALALFGEAVDERVRQGKPRQIGVARWAVARTLRALGRIEEALAAQNDLVLWLAAAQMTDSYVEEEIGECLAALGRSDEAAGHFQSAAQLLSGGGPGETADPERLARLHKRAAELSPHRSTTPEPGRT
jgi:tetratricopeptide (TPR) repeat protein